MSCNSCNPEPKFSRIEHWGQTNVSRRIEENVKAFYHWAFLCIGAWKNIRLANGDWSCLRAVGDCSPGYENRVFQSARKNWVWEPINYTSMTGSTIQPVTPQIYVNGALQTGNYQINYPDGQVIFDAATTGDVTAEYSFTNVQIYCASDVPWWRELQQLSWQIEDNHFKHCENGDWQVGSHNRVQMPCIIISAIGGTNEPYCLGGCEIKRNQEIMFDVFAETDCERDNLLDIILNQDERKYTLYNPDDVFLNSAQPLDCQGFLQNSGSTLPSLLENYEWGCTRVIDTTSFGVNDLRCGLYEGSVRATYETIFSCL